MLVECYFTPDRAFDRGWNLELKSFQSSLCQKRDYRNYDSYRCDAEEGSGTQLPSNVVPQFITNEMSVEHVMSYLRD